jgi:hypothetical protein
MNTALAIRPRSFPLAPFGLCADMVMLDQALVTLEHGYAADRDLDAAIYEALGWQVVRTPISRRRITWQARSPLSTAWQALPAPTADLADAASLVPHGWDWWGGVRGGQARGWVQERRMRPGRDLPVFFEQSRLTPARSLAAAALFAQRFIAMGGTHG